MSDLIPAPQNQLPLFLRYFDAVHDPTTTVVHFKLDPYHAHLYILLNFKLTHNCSIKTEEIGGSIQFQIVLA